MTGEYRLIRPGLVPIRILGWLASAGIHATCEVHEHIRRGTLQTLPGIGPKRERHIIAAYTEIVEVER